VGFAGIFGFLMFGRLDGCGGFAGLVGCVWVCWVIGIIRFDGVVEFVEIMILLSLLKLSGFLEVSQNQIHNNFIVASTPLFFRLLS
jgi:hypothetical protein